MFYRKYFSIERRKGFDEFSCQVDQRWVASVFTKTKELIEHSPLKKIIFGLSDSYSLN